MGVKVLIFALVVIVQVIALYRIATRAEDSYMPGGFTLYYLLLGFFAGVDLGAVVWFLIAVWR